MEVQMKRCYHCGSDYPKEQFHHPYFCPVCERQNPEHKYKLRNCICEECGIEFTHKAASKIAKYCNRKCYMATRRAYKINSPMMSGRVCEVCGKPIGANRGHNAVTCSQECSRVRRNRPATTKAESPATKAQRIQKEKKAQTWKDIIRLCSKLHISYGQYQTLEALGQLDNYIVEHSDMLS